MDALDERRPPRTALEDPRWQGQLGSHCATGGTGLRKRGATGRPPRSWCRHRPRWRWSSRTDLVLEETPLAELLIETLAFCVIGSDTDPAPIPANATDGLDRNRGLNRGNPTGRLLRVPFMGVRSASAIPDSRSPVRVARLSFTHLPEHPFSPPMPSQPGPN